MRFLSRPSLQNRSQRGPLGLSILSLLVVCALLVSINTGYIRLTPIESLQTLLGFGTSRQQLILFDLRLPRILVCILAGAGLAVSGAILQAVSRNALADPGILGINAGAGLAVILFVSYYPLKAGAPVFLLPFLAFLGAAITACLIYSLAFSKREGISPIRLILMGIGVAAGISAATIVLTIRLSPVNYQFVAVWMAGSVWGTNWKFVVALLPWIALLLPLAFYKSRILNVLNMGDQIAVSLGTRLERERLALLGTAVGLSASCVAVAGAIGLVGLVGPHLARRLVGPRHQLLIPASALIGCLLLVVADTVARTLIQPSEIPTGIIVAIVGAPYFLYLLATSKSG